MIRKGKGSHYSIVRYGIPCFANMVCFCVANEYKLISGGELHEMAYIVLFFTLFYEGVALFFRLISVSTYIIVKRSFILVLAIASAALIFSSAKGELDFRFGEKDGSPVEEMGGNMTSLYEDITSASSFLNGDDFFSTYASAQEVVEGKFQPSGTDYIIHVLGDGQREKYLSSFREGDFRYVATIQKSFSPWEYWLERVNWFFYRELYRDYHPVFANTYELYWERNNEEGEYMLTEPIHLEVVPVDDSSVRLIVQTDRGG